MKTKVFKKLVALTLMLLLCVTSLPAFANTYSGGPRDYELDRSLLLEAKNVSIEGNTLNFASGGEVKFDVLLQFDAAELQFKYEAPAKDVTLSIVTDENSYEAVLGKETTEKAIEIAEVSGSHTVTFKADRALVLRGINFHKVDEQYTENNSNAVEFSDYEDAMVTLVALNCDIGVVKAKNNLLRWNPEDIYLAPKNINGSIYAPAKKFAEALSLYCEDYQDLSYLYMLGETSSISLKNGKGFYEDNENGQKDLSIDVRYENGTTWVPVRKLAETFGFTVGYKEGYVLVGDRLRIDKVFNDNSLFRQLKDEFNTYKVPGKKAEGKTYHVAQTAIASDANSGTEEYPFLTIQKAADVAKAGDTVIVHEGTYRETVKPKNNGSAMAPIVFRAAEGEKVVISALEKLSKFIDYRGDIVCATAPIDLGFGRNQVFYKGEQLIEGRHPNEHTKPGESEYPPEVPKGLYATKGNIRITEYRGTKAYSSTDLEQDEVDYWKGGTYVTLKGYGWSLVSGEIVGSAKGELTLTDHEGTVSYNLGILPSVYHGTHYYYEHALESDYAYITNHINTLDLPGEWFMKDNIMYMIPPKDADLKNDFEIKQRQLCIDLREKMYITFDGIDTIGGSMTADNATGCTLLNGEFKNVAHHTVLLDQNGYTMSADEDPYSYDSQKNGEAGFYFSGQYNALVNCVIDRSSATGIQLRDRYQYVNNCIIKNCSYSGGYPGNICVSGDKEMWAAGEFAGGHFVTYNTLYNAGRGVYNAGTAGTKADGTYYGSAPCEMAYNRCFNGALNTRDTGVTYEYGYTGGNDVAKTAMHHNYVYDAGHWDKDEGSKLMLLYQDGFTASRDTYSNVTWYDDATKPVTPKHGIFVQNAQWSILRSRNNAELGYLPNGEDMIERSDYPGGRTFTTGADFGEYIHRNMANYEAHDKGVLYDKPVDIKVNKETGAEVFSFKDVDFKDGGVILNYYMERKVGAPGSFNVTARVYNKDGKLVYEGANPNTASTTRFYVHDVHKGVVILNKVKAGTYDIELEFSDDSSNVYFIMPKFFDVKYDNLYTKEDEAAGKLAYNPVDTSIDEETGKETFSFSDVTISGGVKTLFKIHGVREQSKPTNVDITTNVYNKAGELVYSGLMPQTLTNKLSQQYEVLAATTVIPEIEEGTYDVDFVFGDTYFDVVRIMPSDADPMYNNLFDRTDVFTGGSFDDWTKGEKYELDLSRSLSYSEDSIKNFTYYPAGNCWDHTIYYKDRTTLEDAKMLRVTTSSGSGYSGSKVKLYVDSLDSEPIAEWEAPNTNWQAQAMYVDLLRPLEAGKHTFIFEFDGDMLCSTLWNFSFCNEVWDMDKEN